MRKYFLLLIYTIGIVKIAHSQTSNSFDNMTYFFVDNSSGYQADALSSEMVDDLKVLLNKIALKNDNCFFFYGCNGQEQKTSFELKGFNTGSTLKSYLNKESKESDYTYDLHVLRESMAEYPVKIKQSLEVYLYLSSYALKRMMKRPSELPPALVFTREIPIYISDKDLEIKINLFLSKEIVAEIGEQTIKNYFNFCNQNINLKPMQFQLNSL
jgi:hypothetical protein